MLRSLLFLLFLPALVAILAAVIGTELWLPDYGPANIGLRLPTIRELQKYIKKDMKRKAEAPSDIWEALPA